MKKSFLLVITLAVYVTASSGCWSAKPSKGLNLTFSLNGQTVDVAITPPPEPKKINEKRFEGRYTETSSVRLSPNDQISFGYLHHDDSDFSQSGIWHIKDDDNLLLFNGDDGRVFQKDGKIFVFLNHRYLNDKYGLVFEVRQNKLGEIALHEIFFMVGEVWKVIPPGKNKIQVIGYSNTKSGPLIAEIEIGANQVAEKYGKFVKSVPTMNEYYGIE